MELKIFGISTATNLKNICVILMQETEGKRLLPLIVTPEESKEVLKAAKTKSTHSPMLALASTWGIKFERITIEMDKQGVPTCWLTTSQDYAERTTCLSIAEALAVAVRMNCPITMSDEDFSIQYQDEMCRVNIPISRMNKELLQEALETAVKEEDFETAAVLRDEINRRK